LFYRYEAHHGVRITEPALAAAASLSDRYLPDRHLPDKAIDLIDEAASKVKTDLVLKPEALDRAERRIRCADIAGRADSCLRSSVLCMLGLIAWLFRLWLAAV
jgi:ATP-dependent Clp protease ATP-binding subunit ClpA